MAPKVLFVLTSANKLANGSPTGWYLPEFAHPYNVLDGKTEITVASPNGGEAPIDPTSVEWFKDDVSVNFLNSKQSLWKNTQKLADFAGKAGSFDAIFFVGGHGPMFDLADDATSQQIVREFWEAGKVVSAVCHGPAALVNVKLSDGSSLLQGKSVTAFPNAAESELKLTDAVPFSLEDALNKSSGGKFDAPAKSFDEKVVIDGKLITGANPNSSTAVGQAIAKAIGA